MCVCGGAKWNNGWEKNSAFAAFVPLLISRKKSLKDSRQFSTVSFTQKSSEVMILAGLILRISNTAASFRPSMWRPNTTILRQGGRVGAEEECIDVGTGLMGGSYLDIN